MAWALRRFLVFPVFGSGDYSVQPIYAEDLAVDAWSRAKSFVFDAAGQERFFFEALMRLLASVVGARVRLVMELVLCEYIQRRENVIAIGNSDTDKTHVALGPGRLPEGEGGGLHRRRPGPPSR